MVKFRPGIRIEVFVARPFFQRAAVATNEKTRRKRGEKNRPPWFSSLLCTTPDSKPAGTSPSITDVGQPVWEWKYYAARTSLLFTSGQLLHRRSPNFPYFRKYLYKYKIFDELVTRKRSFTPRMFYTRGRLFFIYPRFFYFSFLFFLFSFFVIFFFANTHLLDASNKNHRTLDSFYRGRCLNVSFICLFARTTLKITPRHGCALLHDDLAGNCATIFSVFSTLGYFLSLSFFFFFWFYFTTSRLERELLSTVPCFMDCYIRRTLVSHARDLYLYIPSMLFVVIQIEQVELLPVRVELNELVFRARFRIIMRSGSNALCNRHSADSSYYEKLVLHVLPKIKFMYKKKVWRKFVRKI